MPNHNNLSGFFAANAKTPENIKVVISDRFKDEKGESIPWEIRALSAEENNALLAESQKLVPLPGKAGKRGQRIEQTDIDVYKAKLVSAAVVFPPLNNAELQDSYGVMGSRELLGKLLIPGEYNALLETVQLINGFDAEAAIEEAKD